MAKTTEPHITKNGEITTKDGLIAEIEGLLNTIPDSSHTTLSPVVMAVLSYEDLENIRDSLLAKTQDVISHNKEWLLGLVDR